MRTAMNGSGRAGASIEEFLIRMRLLLDALNDEGVEATTALRERISASIDTLEPRIEQWRKSAAETTGYVRKAVEDHPWSAVATGAVAGMAVGCVAAVIAANFIPEYTRPYVRRARRLANDYWPF